ncbi:hypothetical protein RUM44_008215 [Polyplax serrata]|uniref:Uncharacterized protein n=1 Tax=Polyplax serrata TaxID=468196 RepID=A0ABR1B7U9_POLSC
MAVGQNSFRRRATLVIDCCSIALLLRPPLLYSITCINGYRCKFEYHTKNLRGVYPNKGVGVRVQKDVYIGEYTSPLNHDPYSVQSARDEIRQGSSV